VGLDAPSAVLAKDFANTSYNLWFANQVGRYNIQHGLLPPASGHWKNNPEAESIDFQIEADFAGLMCPGMPAYAARICDSVGHIMNYGDGYYGGVFVATMYSVAFFEKKPEDVIQKALISLPPQSGFRKCMEDVVRWHQKYPTDWKQTWFELQKKWGNDNGSPIGIFVPWNIDAKINAAYVLMGLLYGNGDFGKTMEIAIRCGNDSDCNPGTAAGILGVMYGYEKIPAVWKQGLEKVENLPFMGTKNSLNSAAALSLKHAMWVAERNGGKSTADSVYIKKQPVRQVAWEQNMPNHIPTEKLSWNTPLTTEKEFSFNGIGYAVAGRVLPEENESDHVFMVEVWLDGKKVETTALPAAFSKRKFIPFFLYDLPKGPHQVKFNLLNPSPAFKVNLDFAVIYDASPTVVK
ncbi:MAG: ADP-ribosylglycohydrolase family protein, partial [Cytophagales bacterium]|nr:ADP-ribosylglycohydrolase family protein [Cytophagales bacterium]